MIKGRQFAELYKPIILRAVEIYPTELIYQPFQGAVETIAQAFRWAGKDLLHHPNWITSDVMQTQFLHIWPLIVTRPDSLRDVVCFQSRARLPSRARLLDARIRLQRGHPKLPVLYTEPDPIKVSLTEIHALCQLVQNTSERQEFQFPLTPEQVEELETLYLGIAIVESERKGIFTIV